MTGMEYAKEARANYSDERFTKRFCPDDFGIATERSIGCHVFKSFEECKKCWESEVVK